MEVIDVAACYDRRGEAKKLFTKVFRLVRAEVSIYTVFHLRFVVYHYMLPYILKICGFKNSIVYTLYGMYRKYTVL